MCIEKVTAVLHTFMIHVGKSEIGPRNSVQTRISDDTAVNNGVASAVIYLWRPQFLVTSINVHWQI